MKLDRGTLERIEAIESERFHQNKHEVSNDENKRDDLVEIIAGKLRNITYVWYNQIGSFSSTRLIYFSWSLTYPMLHMK